jgi:hypothetical protein
VASGPRAQAKAQRESDIRSSTGGPTSADRRRASEAADAAAKAAGAGAVAAFLGLAGSLIGALAATRRTSLKGMMSGLRPTKEREMPVNGMHETTRRDETTITPPRT